MVVFSKRFIYVYMLAVCEQTWMLGLRASVTVVVLTVVIPFAANKLGSCESSNHPNILSHHKSPPHRRALFMLKRILYILKRALDNACLCDVDRADHYAEHMQHTAARCNTLPYAPERQSDEQISGIMSSMIRSTSKDTRALAQHFLSNVGTKNSLTTSVCELVQK